jgi:hypothetical protein
VPVRPTGANGCDSAVAEATFGLAEILFFPHCLENLPNSCSDCLELLGKALLSVLVS